MNIATFERAQLARFAYLKARHTGSLDCMRAICYVIRNRVKAGWGNGTWLDLIENDWKVEGNKFGAESEVELDANDRLLQLLVRDVDDIYMGMSQDDTRKVVDNALYFMFIDRPATTWFRDKIVRDSQNHQRIAQVGTIALFR